MLPSTGDPVAAPLAGAARTAVLAADKPLSSAGSGQLILAALLGIAAVVILIGWAKFHPFLALILGTAVLGAAAMVPPEGVLTSFTKGLGSTFGSVGLLIALGAMLGKLLADSGGAAGSSTASSGRSAPARCRGRWP